MRKYWANFSRFHTNLVTLKPTKYLSITRVGNVFLHSTIFQSVRRRRSARVRSQTSTFHSILIAGWWSHQLARCLVPQIHRWHSLYDLSLRSTRPTRHLLFKFNVSRCRMTVDLAWQTAWRSGKIAATWTQHHRCRPVTRGGQLVPGGWWHQKRLRCLELGTNNTVACFSSATVYTRFSHHHYHLLHLWELLRSLLLTGHKRLSMYTVSEKCTVFETV